jgi:glucosamine--fructose-6-phosphate aminotransferase (isomerizing)
VSYVPELRDGPPWIMEEMVAAQPGLARALLDSPPDGVADVAAAVRDASGPVTVVGCGTSEHGAMAVAAQLDRALGGGWPPRVIARQSLDAAERPQAGGVCIGISHDGGTRATQLALEAASAGGATTALVTGVQSARAADHVLVTPVHDDSWCHTVAYVSAILVGAALARELRIEGVSGAGAEALLAAPDEVVLPVASRVVVAGAGLDLITARELALKIAEGARIPTVVHHLETLLHGHLAGEDASTAAVLVQTEAGDGRVARRAGLAAAALREIGIDVAEIGPPPPTGGLDSALARLLWGAISLQRLTLSLAAARGVNPDLIRREEEPWQRAGDVSEGAGDW